MGAFKPFTSIALFVSNPPRCWCEGMARVLTYMSAAVLLFGSTVARADDAIAEWARWALTPKVWKGVIVQAPIPAERPARLPLQLRSLEQPLALHAPAR